MERNSARCCSGPNGWRSISRCCSPGLPILRHYAPPRHMIENTASALLNFQFTKEALTNGSLLVVCFIKQPRQHHCFLFAYIVLQLLSFFHRQCRLNYLGRRDVFCPDLPRCPRHDLGGRKDFAGYQSPYDSRANSELFGCPLKIQAVCLLLDRACRELQMLSKGTNPRFIPGVASSGFQTDAVQGERYILVRIVAGHLANKINSLRLRASAVMPRFQFAYEIGRASCR